LLLSCWTAAAAAQAPARETPGDYSHAIPLTVSGKNAVVQLRLPQAVYLHARSADLRDLRVFDASGKVVPFAVTQGAAQAQATRRELPVTIFPVTNAITWAGEAAAEGGAVSQSSTVKNDFEIRTSADGSVTSITTRHGRAPVARENSERLGALVLDLGKGTPAIDALAFTLPDGRTSYHAQVELEVSDDLRSWESLAFSNLSWLVNGEGQALTSNRMEFAPRAFRYARLSWHDGTPLLFAKIVAEAPSLTETPEAMESMTVAPAPGKFKDDILYATPVAIPVRRVNLQFGERSVVLPGELGHYVELPAAKGVTATRWDFRPRLQATFFQLTQGGVQRKSADIIVDEVHESNWVARSAGLVLVQPSLRLSWTPQTLVFMAASAGPYSLSFGRSGAQAAQLGIAQVAPGFTAAELQAAERAVAGQLQVVSVQPQDDSAAQAAGKAAHKRMLMLWGVLLLGVAVLGVMAWKLIGQMKSGE
jgi:hypothetical protein